MTHLADGFVAHALQNSDQLAIGFLDGQFSGDSSPKVQLRTCTYGELLTAAQKVAAIVAPLVQNKQNQAERMAGLNPVLQNTVRIGLLLPNCPEFLEIFLGVTIAGGVAMVFDPKWTLDQVQQVIGRSAPALVFVASEWVAQIEKSFPNLPLICVPQRPEAEEATAIGNIRPKSQTPAAKRQNLCSVTSEVSGRESSEASNTPFYVGFTSGTTGIPKGVVRSHQSWVNSFAASQIEFGTCAADRILVPGSLTHSLSLYTALECLNAGATLYLLPKFSAKAVLRLLDSQQITVLVAVPALLKPIAKQIISQTLTCPALRTVIAGGSKLDLSLRSELPLAFPTAEILEYFGALELSFISLATSREAVPPDSVGRSFQGVELSIRQLDGAGEAAIGEVGWVGVKSQMFSLGYLEQVESSESGYRVVDGWATVGDLGWQDAKGYLHLVGREQDMILSGGINIYPAEVETVLCSLPEVADAVVVGIPDGDRGQVVGAAIQWVGAPLSRSELLHRLRTQLEPTKFPRYVITVDQFPTTSTGKVRRSVVREQIVGAVKN
ncbi:AMP-binding protein [Egbenema bharatensis]|uniref:AMP-binding protein n=1 Tax=Egbenema bharatensis TaxID=3463334 RepID=UPI003A8B754F